MPVILLQRLPLPSLRTYTAFSVVLLASAIYYAHIDAIGGDIDPDSDHDDSLNDPENPLLDPDEVPPESVTYVHAHKFEELRFEKEEPTINFTEVLFPSFARNGTDENVNSYGVKMATVLLSETWCIWSLVNTACCCLILLGRGIQKIVFGDLRVSEQQHLRDKFWNFAFYKFIFIFGVMNVQSMEEVVLWSSWFSILACLHLLAQLCKDRFEYLSFSPATPVRTHLKVLLLLFGIQTTCAALLAACLFIGYLFVGLNIFAFMTAEVFLLMIKTSYVMVRYSIHLWDLHHDSVWENRSVYIYYSELVFELIAISVDFCNHLHMLVWSNIFLSMASLVICMQLRYLFHELQRRVRRHKNYLRVVTTMDEKFKMATLEELEQNDDDCSICWDKMRRARKLPCGHFFHNACLRSWLEQDTSCPICRKSLADLQTTPPPRPGPPEGTGDPPPAGDLQRPPLNQNMMTNHFFHFDASRYVSWLPSFSVEVSHTQILGNRLQAAQTLQTSQLDNMARQVQEVFPHIPLATALTDLQMTRSVEMTIENIVEGRLVAPPTFPRTDLQDSDSDSSGSGSDDSDSSMSSYSVVPSSWTGPEEGSGGLYDPLPPSPASSLNFNVPDRVAPAEPAAHEPAERPQPSQNNFPVLSGCRFSKSPTEREAMLEERKEHMLQHARRQFLTSDLGHNMDDGDNTPPQTVLSIPIATETRSPTFLSSSNFSESGTDSESGDSPHYSYSESGEPAYYSYSASHRELDAAVRRERAFLAAQRRMQRD